MEITGTNTTPITDHQTRKKKTISTFRFFARGKKPAREEELGGRAPIFKMRLRRSFSHPKGSQHSIWQVGTWWDDRYGLVHPDNWLSRPSCDGVAFCLGPRSIPTTQSLNRPQGSVASSNNNVIADLADLRAYTVHIFFFSSRPISKEKNGQEHRGRGRSINNIVWGKNTQHKKE